MRLSLTLFLFPFLLYAEGEPFLEHLGTNPNLSKHQKMERQALYYFGFTKESHYYQITLPEDKERYFHFENGMFSEFDFALLEDGVLLKNDSAGLLRKKNPVVSYTGGFLIPAKEKGTYQFRIRSDDTHRINFRIRKESELFQYTKTLSLWQGLYLGLCLLLALFTAIQYVLLREKISLYLTIAIVTVLFTNLLRSGLFYEFEFSNLTWFFRYVPGLLALSSIGLVLFLREFLHTKKLYSNFDKYLILYIYFLFLSMFIVFIDLQLFFRFIYTNSLMLSTFTFGYSIYSLFKKEEHAKVLFFAFLVRQISTLLLIFTNTGFLPSFPFLSSANEIGAAIQMTIFTIVVSKFQIQTRILKEQTVTKVNEELEFMVLERTKELQLQKEKLENAILQLSQTENQLALSEKMTELGKLVAGVAHEINNPLSAIKASIETLMESKQNETLQLGSKENVYSSLDLNQIQTLTRMFQHQSDFGLVASYTERKEKKAELKKILKDNDLDYDEATLEKFLDVGITKLEENQILLLQKRKRKTKGFNIRRKKLSPSLIHYPNCSGSFLKDHFSTQKLFKSHSFRT